eukprot:Gb_30165 [translate_table: standard]
MIALVVPAHLVPCKFIQCLIPYAFLCCFAAKHGVFLSAKKMLRKKNKLTWGAIKYGNKGIRVAAENKNHKIGLLSTGSLSATELASGVEAAVKGGAKIRSVTVIKGTTKIQRCQISVLLTLQ